MADDRNDDRRRMLDDIARHARQVADLTGCAAISPRVLAAMEAVPRHRFVPADMVDRAYDDRPLPIGGDQTISQPFVVALMTELLALRPADRVLEVGTGCGYQTAVLAELAGSVHSVERIATLAADAARHLSDLGYRDVELRRGDGTAGWPEAAPFDAIIVTAAPAEIPGALAQQLAPGGRMVIPVGRDSANQVLKRGLRGSDGRVAWQDVLPVAFVAMIAG